MRAIIPIYNEADNISIKNKKELIDFIKSEDSTQKMKTICSGDIERMLFGYAEEDLLNKMKQKKEAIHKLNEEERGFLVPGEISINTHGGELTAGEYVLNDNGYGTNGIELIGYHRQKTRLMTKKEVVIKNNVSATNVLFKKMKRGESAFIIIENNASLILENSILDAITIIVKDGARLILNNVQINGSVKGIEQQGEGFVESNNVYFNGVAYEYHFENMNKNTAINIVDFEDKKSISDFLRRSMADNIEIDTNMIFDEEIKIKTPVNFVNKTDDDILLQFEQLNIMANFKTTGKIVVKSKISISDVSDVNIDLSKIFGSIEVVDSQKIKIQGIYEKDPSSEICIFVKNSETVINAKIYSKENHGIGVETTNSKILFKNSLISNFEASLLGKKEKENEEDEVLIKDEMEFSEVYFDGLRITKTGVAIESKYAISKIEGKDINITSSYKGMDITGSQVLIDNMRISGISSTPILFKETDAIIGGSSIIENIADGVKVENKSFVEMRNILFKDIEKHESISVMGATIILRKPVFENVLTAIYSRKGGFVVTEDPKFINVKHSIQKEHGSLSQMDYIEYIEELKKREGVNE